MSEALVSLNAFGKAAGVSTKLVNDAVKTGKLSVYSRVGRKVSPSFDGRKFLKLEEATNQFSVNRERVTAQFLGRAATEPGKSGHRDLVAAKAATAEAQSKLLALRLEREQASLVPAEAVTIAARSVGIAIQRIAAGIMGWADEISGAHARGGVRAVTACLKVKSVELASAMSGALIAEANELVGARPDLNEDENSA